MAGRGPPPKPTSQRRRRNKTTGTPPVTIAAATDVRVPAANAQWHPIAKRWYRALASSPQVSLFQPSDWATAYVIAESMSREFSPRPVKVGRGDDAEVVMMNLPVSPAALNAWRIAFAGLLVTEGDRRRAHVEIVRPTAATGATGEAGDVEWLADFRARLRGPDRYVDL